MSEKELQKFSKSLEKAENTARIRMFDKAASQYQNLIDTAKALEPDLANGFQFLALLYAVNHDISKQNDPIETGSLRNLNALSTAVPNTVLTMALPGGVFGDYETDRIFSEARGILMMNQGVRDKDTKVLQNAIEHFLQIGKKPLFFSRYVGVIGRRVTGNRAALECEAKSEIVKAAALADSDPNGAIPHYMLATRALRAARRIEDERKYREILIGLKMVRPCWFCGRVVQGANHFIRMSSEVTPYFEKLLRENNEDLRVLSNQEIHACIPCATAITNEANRIASHYRDILLQRIELLSTQILQLQEVMVAKGDLVRNV